MFRCMLTGLICALFLIHFSQAAPATVSNAISTVSERTPLIHVSVTVDEPNECRLCLDHDDEEIIRLSPRVLAPFANTLIHPCQCSGTQEWIHASCFIRLLASRESSPLNDKCSVCYALYDTPNYRHFKKAASALRKKELEQSQLPPPAAWYKSVSFVVSCFKDVLHAWLDIDNGTYQNCRIVSLIEFLADVIIPVSRNSLAPVVFLLVKANVAGYSHDYDYFVSSLYVGLIAAAANLIVGVRWDIYSTPFMSDALPPFVSQLVAMLSAYFLNHNPTKIDVATATSVAIGASIFIAIFTSCSSIYVGGCQSLSRSDRSHRRITGSLLFFTKLVLSGLSSLVIAILLKHQSKVALVAGVLIAPEQLFLTSQ